MSKNPQPLPLDDALPLARKIAADLVSVCERVEIVGSVRRRKPLVGDIELLCIPKFSASLLPGVPGVSLLDMHLVALCNQGRLMRATDTPIQELVIKPFYIGSLLKRGQWLKLEINTTTADAWPVLMAIKTGPAEFSHRLVCHSDNPARGFLPRGWRVGDGWQVWDDKGERRQYESERQFIEEFCGAWIEPEKR